MHPLGSVDPRRGLIHGSQKRLKHKAAEMKTRMGEDQTGMLHPVLSPKQQIKVQGSRPPTLLQGALPTKLRFQLVQCIQQSQRRPIRWSRKQPMHDHYSVPVARLIRRATDRGCVD
mgnify:FL=1